MGRKKIDKVEDKQAEQAEQEVPMAPKAQATDTKAQATDNPSELKPVDILFRDGKIIGRFLAMRGSNMLIKKGLKKIEVPAGKIEKIVKIKDSVMRNVYLK